MAGMISPTLLRASGLRLTRSGRCLLNDVSVSIAAGELIAVLGANGAGKSTLLQVLRGGWEAESGDVWLGDEPLATFSPTARAQRMAYLPQQAAVCRCVIWWHWDASRMANLTRWHAGTRRWTRPWR
ncbi:MAG: ATP-binding cassette domain-containing protein [Gammaproteobacteria bacterium]|nr:MAG: ATP-binding cassette domain-containing protein [Gammaproteobacteria bacterium]